MFSKYFNKYKFWKLPHIRFPELVFWEPNDNVYVADYVKCKYNETMWSGTYIFLKLDNEHLMFSNIDGTNIYTASILKFNKFKNKSMVERNLRKKESEYERTLRFLRDASNEL